MGSLFCARLILAQTPNAEDEDDGVEDSFTVTTIPSTSTDTKVFPKPEEPIQALPTPIDNKDSESQDKSVLSIPSPTSSSDESSIESEEGVEIVIEKEPFEEKVMPTYSSIQTIDFTTPLNIETSKSLDKESSGKYTSTQKKLKKCKELPMDVVWQHFSPYFTYKWSPDFINFSALFLAIWEQESRFHSPRKAVHVNPNCRGLKATLVRSTPTKFLKGDIRRANEKMKKLTTYYPRCNLKKADFGPLQWNYHWRLSQKMYRPQIEKALLLSTQYDPSRVKKLPMEDVARLIQFNPRALFVLAGLSLKDQAKNPKLALRRYNSNKKYQTKVHSKYRQYLKTLRQKKTCSGK